MITHDLFYSALIEEYKQRPRRIKRAWLEERLLNALKKTERDFVLISGEPGTGKSSFTLELAARHPNWPRYLIRKDQVTPFGEPSPRAVLLQVGFQLAARYPNIFQNDQLRVVIKQRIEETGSNSEIVGAEVDRLMASPFYKAVYDLEQQIGASHGKITALKVGEWVADPNLIPLADLQNMALFDPALALAQEKKAEPIIVLIDALDELRYRNDRGELLSWLANLPELPANLKFVLTSRPDDVLLGEFRRRQGGRLVEIRLREDDPDLQADVREYATALANEPRVRQVLEINQGVTAFIDQAVLKANSNLGYLDAVGRAVDQALQNNQPQLLAQILDMQSLPDSLRELYGAFLGWLRSAVEAESVEVEDAQSGEIHLVRAWTGVYIKIMGLLAVAVAPLGVEQMRRYGGILPAAPVVRDALQRMSQFLDRPGDRFRLYHTALAEYLTDLDLHTRENTQDFAIDAVAWHKRIADVAWRSGAPTWQTVDEYALNGLAMHLLGAGDREGLRLLAAQAWMAARFKAAGHTYAGFMDDLRTERKIFTASNLPNDAPDLLFSGLLTTGLVGLSDDLPPGLILRLVTTGVWSGSRALDTVARFTDLRQAERAYQLLLEHAGLEADLVEAAQHGYQTAKARLNAQAYGPGEILAPFDFAQIPVKQQMRVTAAVKQVLGALQSPDHSLPDWVALYQAMNAAYRKGIEQTGANPTFGPDLWAYLGVGLAFTLPQPRIERHRLMARSLEWLAQIHKPSKAMLKPELLDTALQQTFVMPAELKAQALGGLAQLAPDEMVPRLLEATLVQAAEPGFRSVLDALAERLDARQAEQAAAGLRQATSDTPEQTEMLLALLAILPAARRGDVLQSCLDRIPLLSLADAYNTTSPQARIRKRVLPYLEGKAFLDNLEQAIHAIQAIPVRPNQSLVLKALELAEFLPFLPPERATELAQEALKLVDVEEPVFVQYVLPAVYPFLSAGNVNFGGLRVAGADEAAYQELIHLTQSLKKAPPADLVWQVLLSAVGELQHIQPPGRVLRLIAANIPDAQLKKATRIALDHPQDPECGQALLILLPRLEEELLQQIAATSWGDLPPGLRWRIRGAAASRLDEKTAAELKAQAFADLSGTMDSYEQADLIGCLAQVQPGWIAGATKTCLEICWELLQPDGQEPRSEYLRRGAALAPALGILLNTERLEAFTQALLLGLDWQWL